MGREDKVYNVIISDRASEMLVSHIRFLAQVSIKSANELRMEIISSANSLQKMPERYSYIDDPELPQNKYRKAIVSKRYLLIYQIKDNKVYIDYILDCRQNYDWLL
jgi:hypothetical protein